MSTWCRLGDAWENSSREWLHPQRNHLFHHIKGNQDATGTTPDWLHTSGHPCLVCAWPDTRTGTQRIAPEKGRLTGNTTGAWRYQNTFGNTAVVAGCRHAVPDTAHYTSTRTSDTLALDRHNNLLCPCHNPNNWLLTMIPNSPFILWKSCQQPARTEPGTPGFPSNPHARVCHRWHKERPALWECWIRQLLTTNVELAKTNSQASHC